MNKGYRIVSIEAKDIYRKAGNLTLDITSESDRSKYFTNILEWSLDSIKIFQQLKKETTKEERQELQYVDKFKIEYSLVVVQVKFTRAAYEDDVDNKKTNVIDTSNLRMELYEKGFSLNGRHYVRYKRSSGSSREGNCLFILDNLAIPMKKWSDCKLKYDENNPSHDLASWEAYRALSLSAIVGLIDIPLNGILFLKDVKETFKTDAVIVKKEKDILSVHEGTTDITNNIWDGEALLDDSLFIKNTKPLDISKKSMLLLRNKFFKTCAFRTKLKQFFRDKGIKSIDELIEKSHGYTTAKNIEDIVMVVTESSLKYCKFSGGLSQGTIEKWTSCVDATFGIVKYDKRTHYMSGDLVQSSYQLINTLELETKEVQELLQPTKSYMSLFREDLEVLAYHLAEMNKGESLEDISDIESNNVESRADIMLRLLNLNKNIYNTKIFKQFKNGMSDDMKKKIAGGNVLFHGTNATLFGNGPELLKALVGEYDGQSAIKPGEISCSKFNDNEEIVGARSPHITMGNLLYSKNVLNYELSEYFVLSENIVCVNAINENIQHRLNGCDYDSDSMFLTNDKYILASVKKHYNKFKVPVYEPGGKAIKANRTLSELDHVISNNLIGQIVNLSQRLNSLYWDTEDCKKRTALYLDICKLAVLSGLEIDRAKRESGLNCYKILDEINNKYNEELSAKPIFFKNIEKEYDWKDSKKESTYRLYNCPMEFVSNIASEIDYRKGKAKISVNCSIKSLFNAFPKHNVYDKVKYLNMRTLTDDCYRKIAAINLKIKKSDTTEAHKQILREDIQNIKKELVSEYSKHWNTYGFNKLMLEFLAGPENRCKGLVFDMLFQKENTKLYEYLIEDEMEKRLEKNASGDISIYGYNFKKVSKI